VGLNEIAKVPLLAELCNDVNVVYGLAYLMTVNDIVMADGRERFNFVAYKHFLNLCLGTSNIHDFDSDGLFCMGIST
jgi:hypothetical protein